MCQPTSKVKMLVVKKIKFLTDDIILFLDWDGNWYTYTDGVLEKHELLTKLKIRKIIPGIYGELSKDQTILLTI